MMLASLSLQVKSDIFFSYRLDDLTFEGIEKALFYSPRMLALAPKSHRLAYQSVISTRDPAF